MSFPLKFFLVRATLTALAMVSLGLAAVAQSNAPHMDTNNPVDLNHAYEGMRTNAGEQLMGDGRAFNESRWDFDYNFSFWQDYFRTEVIVIPPLPPALGEALPLGGFAGSGGHFPAMGEAHPAGSANFPAVTCSREIFYGPYATLVGRYQVSPKETERVAAYQGEREKLLREIQAKFEELRDAAPAERKAALAELSAQQDGRLRAIEAEAEAIRSGMKWVDAKYYYLGPPRLGKKREAGSLEQSLRLIKAVYDFAGLSPEQRQLLPEIAFDVALGKNEKTTPAGEHSDLIFFSPATARIRLPANLTPALDAKIHAFIADKEVLKAELRDAVLRDNEFFASQRTQRLIALAAAQAPRFAALEVLAEDIRVGLADYSWFDLEKGSLPSDLTQRVGDFYARKVKVRREVLSRLRQFRAEFPRAQFDIARQDDGLAIVQTGPNPKTIAGLAEFNAGLSSRYAAFASESEILRRDIQRYTETNPKRVARSVDQLASDFQKAYATQENWNRYRNYFRAVLAPGLSSIQRRLMFQSAAEELDQAGPTPQT